jgi:hypothetical protein
VSVEAHSGKATSIKRIYEAVPLPA